MSVSACTIVTHGAVHLRNHSESGLSAFCFVLVFPEVFFVVDPHHLALGFMHLSKYLIS
jgi:hypothetical protein